MPFAPDGFSSFRNFFSFIAAEQFYRTVDEQTVAEPSSRLERLANKPLSLVQIPLDAFIANIKKPVIAVVFLVAGIANWTFFCYPQESFAVAHTALAPLVDLQPWMIKATLYSFGMLQINSLWLRTIARLCDESLVNRWHRCEVMPIHIGSNY